MLQVQNHYKVVILCRISIIPHKQRNKRNSHLHKNYLRTYLLLFNNAVSSAGHVAFNNSPMSELVNNEFLQNVKGGGSGLI